MRSRATNPRTRAVGVVIPVHNEEELLSAALDSLEGALGDLERRRLELGAVVVLDSCDDASATIAHEWRDHVAASRRHWRVHVVTSDATNAGTARGRGCAALLDAWGHLDAGQIWLATTDADSRVPGAWLATQVARHDEGVDLWTGRVAVSQWESRGRDTIAEWTRLYEAEDHPIHGASLGFNAAAYLRVGGFSPLATGEDRELCRRLLDAGAPWYEERDVRVITSARVEARAPRGFAFALGRVDARVQSRLAR